MLMFIDVVLEARELKNDPESLLHLISAKMSRSQQRVFPKSDLVKHYKRLKFQSPIQYIYSWTCLKELSHISITFADSMCTTVLCSRK